VISEAEIEHAFSLIEQAALKGERAPQNEPFGPIRVVALGKLYDTARIRGEIYLNNFRRIVILTGPNRGKGTADPPTPGPPWKIIEKRVKAQKPSLPRILSREEIDGL
jgi:hypothetical protein